MRLTEGNRIGAYEIVDHIGQGGMATVYKAYHERLDRFVAIKLMHETFLQDEDFRARFQREARIIARLEHPNIVPIYDYNEHDGIPYLVMKYISGMTLKRRAIKTGLTLAETHNYLSAVAVGLDYAHSQGILHRDIKPSNIIIDETEQSYITDFGLARIAEAGASTISHDMMLGTPYYISPEQARGERDLDKHTDIYSFGIVLYEMITGQVPFEGDTPYAIVHGHIFTEPVLPGAIIQGIPPAVDDVLEKALAKIPSERYDSASELMAEFGRAIGDTQPEPRPQQIKPEPSRRVTIKPEPSGQVKAPVPPVPPAPPVIPSPQKPMADFQFDMGEIDFSQIGQRLRTGVASLAELIEDRIDSELRERRGVALTDEELIRRRVAKRMKARQDFIKNLTSYLTVNGALLGIWFFTGAGFFWPFFPLFFWGMGLVGQGIDYYSKYGPGAIKQEDSFEQEVRREIARANTLVQPDAEEKAKHGDRLRLSDIQEPGGGVRLNEDGELTDSFVQQQRRRR